MDIEFRCDEHGTIPASDAHSYPRNVQIALCWQCSPSLDFVLICRITKDDKLSRAYGNRAPRIQVYKNGEKLADSDESFL